VSRLRPLVVLLVLGSGALAGAEDAPRKRPGRFKVGPLFLTPKINLRTLGVDSNVYRTESDAIQDSSAGLAGTLDFRTRPERALGLGGQASLAANWFGDQHSQRSLDRSLGAKLSYVAGPLTLSGGGNLLRSKQRFTIDFDQRIPRAEDTVEGSARFVFRRRSSLLLRGSQVATTFDASTLTAGVVKASLDRTSTLAGAELRIGITNRTSLLLSSELARDHFVNETLGGEAKSRRHLAGLEMGLAALVSGQLLFGVQEFPEGADQGAPPRRDLAVEAKLSMPTFPLGRLEGGYRRTVGYAARPADVGGTAQRNTFLSGRWEARLARELPESLIGRLEWSRETTGYSLPYVTASGETVRDEHYRSIGLSLLRAFGRNLRLGGQVVRYRRDSTLPGADFASTTYGFQGEWVP
jgi:hypothetical protein